MAHSCSNDRPCPCPPHPELVQSLRSGNANGRHIPKALLDRPTGLNDGAIFNPQSYPEGTSPQLISTAGLDQAKLSGPINVIVVLVQFSDTKFKDGAVRRFQDLFFSHKKLPTPTLKSIGSVTEFYEQASNNLISITGKVVGPYTLPQTAAYYGNNDHGMTKQEPNTRTMAGHTVDAVIKYKVGLEGYDNRPRQPGYVDAFIIVHTGRGGEVTGANINDIWSCKWVLPSDKVVPNQTKPGSTKVSMFLTVPEDAEVGVCAHEVGHLLFSWPDLYDTTMINTANGKEYASAGVGDWCLMGAGSWGGDGTRPVHPSAWCKASQGWVNVNQQKADSTVYLNEIKNVSSRAADPKEKAIFQNPNRWASIQKLWANGDDTSKEYFLLENRARYGFDQSLPGEGLLIWHIDENQLAKGNKDKNHRFVDLMNAAGKTNLSTYANGHWGNGDASNPFPGTTANRTFTKSTTPNSNSYSKMDTYVAVTNISNPKPTMSMDISMTGNPLTRAKL